MGDSDLVQTTVMLPDELYEWLRETAFRRRVSQSQVVREALEKERGRPETETKPFPRGTTSV